MAEEILIWMISEMMTILGKKLSKRPTPTQYLVGSEDLVVPEDSPSVDTPAWAAAEDAVVNEDRKEFDQSFVFERFKIRVKRSKTFKLCAKSPSQVKNFLESNV